MLRRLRRRRRRTGNPPQLAIVPAESPLHAERPACLERGVKHVEAGLDIVGMNAIEPATAKRVVHGASDCLEPATIEPGAPLVGVARPDHHGGAVGNRREPFLAGPQHGLRLLARDRGAEDFRNQMEAVERLSRPAVWFTCRRKTDRTGGVPIDGERHGDARAHIVGSSVCRSAASVISSSDAKPASVPARACAWDQGNSCRAERTSAGGPSPLRVHEWVSAKSFPPSVNSKMIMPSTSAASTMRRCAG